GEQQRIAIARALLIKPCYLFLDEATSAVDLVTERSLYAVLEDAGITCVSVGHRDSILTFHQYELRLLGHGRWQTRHLGPAGARRTGLCAVPNETLASDG